MTTAQIPYTQPQLVAALQHLGLQAGDMLMLHASVKAVGSLMGGPNIIVHALLETLTPAGTLMMYAGWQDIPDFLDEVPAAVRRLYEDHHPPFDPAIARAVRANSILAQFLCTWPGSRRSANPEASMVAVGAQAAWLTADHPLNYGYGAQSPLDKLVQGGGRVLLLGSPLDSITLLHHAEYLAALRHKVVIHYTCPLLREGEKVWVAIEDFETGEPHDDYTFADIATDYLGTGKGRRGMVGDAESYLFEAGDLTAFAVGWLEARFGKT